METGKYKMAEGTSTIEKSVNLVQEKVKGLDLDFESRELLDKEEREDATVASEEEQLPEVPLRGHVRDEKKRSKDVQVFGDDCNVDFGYMQLDEDIAKGLKLCRYEKPTPIQMKAIPIGKLNYDLLLQAKSGTGKTCVFTVCMLQQVVVSDRFIQGLIISPSREIAIQIAQVVKGIGVFKNGLKVKEFIGGTSIAQSCNRIKKCHIAVGTPGRIAHMIRDFGMDLSKLKVVALDEADKLMDPSYFDDISCILRAFPDKKQLIATSATYEDTVQNFLEKFMKSPYKIQLDLDRPALCAVDQYIGDVQSMISKNFTADSSSELEDAFALKFLVLMEILRRSTFTQAIIFSNYQLRAEKIHDKIKELHLGVDLLSGKRCQDDRCQTFEGFQKGSVKILVATDVASRGIDVEGVDLVINFDVPFDKHTYLHRIGRCGRFGSWGKAVTLCYFEQERKKLCEIQVEIKAEVSVIESMKDLSFLQDDAQTKLRRLRQLKGFSKPLTAADIDVPNFHDLYLQHLNSTENNIEEYGTCSLDIDISDSDLTEEVNKLRFVLKDLQLQKSVRTSNSAYKEEVFSDDSTCESDCE